MEAYAVVETGGKQYRVAVGMTFDIERLPEATSSDVEITEVLAISDGKELRVGKPYVEGAKVVLTVVQDDKRGENSLTSSGGARATSARSDTVRN